MSGSVTGRFVGDAPDVVAPVSPSKFLLSPGLRFRAGHGRGPTCAGWEPRLGVRYHGDVPGLPRAVEHWLSAGLSWSALDWRAVSGRAQTIAGLPCSAGSTRWPGRLARRGGSSTVDKPARCSASWGWCPANTPQTETSAGPDHQSRPAARPPTTRRGCAPLPPPRQRRRDDQSAPGRPGPACRRRRVARAATPQRPLEPSGGRRGKHTGTVVVACARELARSAGGPPRSTEPPPDKSPPASTAAGASTSTRRPPRRHPPAHDHGLWATDPAGPRRS